MCIRDSLDGAERGVFLAACGGDASRRHDANLYDRLYGAGVSDGAYQHDPCLLYTSQYDLQTGVWTEVSGWSRSNWVTWMPGGGTVGDYWIYVEAKTSDGKVETSVYGHHYRGVYVELSGMCLLNPGTRYDIGVAYTTNDPDIKFRWKLYDLAAQEWFLLQDAIPCLLYTSRCV